MNTAFPLFHAASAIRAGLKVRVLLLARLLP